MNNNELNTWPVTVNGRQYAVSLHRGESGKLFVRANGRVLTRPFDDEDPEMTFQLDGAFGRFDREPDGTFSLRIEHPEPVVAVTNTTSAQALFSARAIVWGFIAALVIVPFLWYVSYSRYVNVARRRAEAVLNGLEESPDQETIGLWARNTHRLPLGELSVASDYFTKWLNDKDLYNHPVRRWKVERIAERKAAVKTAEVGVEIDGRRLTLVVPEGQPIEWGEDPK